ncbi:phiSA1p31-related protein [Streptomyces sp. NBC_01267]|uniref:phiSA1p31-related protein n=1 Tax=Streptomyces sp. NBC_01267 TaxID=2903805 RepID=UPI002E3657BA|nr:phiSA1p31-related protein [Streptomyces sp. NBC_01267]
MAEFKVGDKVRVLAGGEGVVTYGPVNSTFDTYKMYIVKQEGDDERAFKSSDLEQLPAFAVGDKVTSTSSFESGRGESEIVAGPFMGRHSGQTFWVTTGSDGKHAAPLEDTLTKVAEPALVPVGTRARIDRAKWAESVHGEIGVVQSNTETWRGSRGDVHPYRVRLDDDSTFHVAELTPVDDEPADGFEYNGETYEYGVLYRDREGDRFEFDSVLFTDGTNTPRGRLTFADGTRGYWSWGLAEVVNGYGPLKKI